VHRIAVPRDAMPLAASIRVLVERGHFDVAMHAQWTTATGSLAARRRGRIGRVVVAAHGRELLWRPPVLAALHERWRRRTLAAVDRVVAVSSYTRELALRIGVAAERTCVVPNGTHVARLCRPDVLARARVLRSQCGAASIVLTVARFVPHKGIDTILRALPCIASAIPDVVYVVIGDGGDRDRLHRLAHERGVAARVRFVGAVDDDEVAAWMHACDVFALASRERAPDVEGFGIVLLDAAACGRPVVAGRSGGTPDAVLHGETGWLCDPELDHEVAQSLIDLLRDRERARAFGAAGRRRVEHGLEWSHAGARLHAVLASLVRPSAGEFAQVSHALHDAR
jgi:phosphatidylinositol alpha-1,6-mannosyltransferase